MTGSNDKSSEVQEWIPHQEEPMELKLRPALSPRGPMCGAELFQKSPMRGVNPGVSQIIVFIRLQRLHLHHTAV